MAIITDQFGNEWNGPIPTSSLRYYPNAKYVWFHGAPNCSWTSPHIKHIVSINEFNAHHRVKTTEIWILEKRNGLSKEIWGAIIGALALIIVALINVFGGENKNDTKQTPPSIEQQDIKGDDNIVIEGNQNTIFVNKTKDWEYEDIKSIKNGDTLSVRVVYKIITDQFRWKFGSHEFLDNGKSVQEALPKYLNTLPDFHKAIGLISVGMASEEGNVNIETDRADRRGDNILLALNPSKIAQNKSIYKLNLGQHKRTDDKKGEETSYQRKIILIGVMSWSGNEQVSAMESCLKEALKGSEGLSFPTNSYSLFKLTTYNINYQRKIYKN